MKKTNCAGCAFRAVCEECSNKKTKCKHYAEDLTLLPQEKLANKLQKSRKAASGTGNIWIAILSCAYLLMGFIIAKDLVAEILISAPQVAGDLKDVLRVIASSVLLLLVLCHYATKANCECKQEKEAEADVH